MCLNCGCGIVDDDHGDSDNLTVDGLRAMAAVNSQTVPETVANILDSLQTLEPMLNQYGNFEDAIESLPNSES